MKMADDGNGKIVKFPVRPVRYRLRDEITIPPRPWIARGLLLRKQLTCMIAAGGTGKSIFGLIVAFHLAAGRDFGPYKCVNGPKRVAIISVEEDSDELDRRLHAIAKVFKFDDDAAANLFIVHMESPIIATSDRRGVVSATEIAAELEKQLSRLVVDVIMIDPFVEVWNGDENSNSQVRSALAVIRSFCRRMDCACLLMHHVKKGGVTPGDIDAGRGASSLGGLVRIAHTITNMSKEEATALGVTKPKGIVRVDHAKGNYLPPPETAAWFEFKSIELNNADERYGSVGDHVGVLVNWTPPGVFDGITYEKIDQILDTIIAGTPDHERWTLASQSKDRFVGKIIAEVAEISEDRAARIASAWKKSGLLYEQEYLSGAQRKTRKGVFVDASKRPSATAEE